MKKIKAPKGAATRYRMAYMTREEWQEYERAVLDEECNSAKETK